MHRILKVTSLAAALCLALWSGGPIQARDQKVRDVDIRLTIIKNGNVVVHECWDVDTGDGITEWYLVRENLGDISIKDFRVFDGDDRLVDDGEWDVDRTREEKAGRYGVVHKSNGVELCWGVGDYGDHQYHAIYVMERAVKTLDDYDMLHLQVVSDGLSAPPQHVRVRVMVAEDGVQLDTTNTRIWGFGYAGRSAFEEDGSAVFESTEALKKDDSVIILLRFEKGLFNSPSVQERPFQEALDRAMEGASFEEKEDDRVSGIAGFFTLLIMYFVFLRPVVRLFRKTNREQKRLKLDFSPKSAPYYRDVPMKGDLSMANTVLSRTGNEPSSGGLPQAMILRLIHQGYLEVTREVEGPAVLSFKDDGRMVADTAARGLLQMLKEAAGADKQLQDKEFSTWAQSHISRISDWSNRARREGLARLSDAGWYNLKKVVLTAAGQEEAQKLFGFQRFLSSYTLVDRREAYEAHLWKEYLVFAALFGVAGHVSKQLKDINPSLFKETFHYDLQDFDTVMTVSSSFSRAVTRAITSAYTPTYSSYSSGSGSSSRGYGGSSSRGGGGGFSGGGRGGGGR